MQFPDCSQVKFEVAPPAFDELLKSFDTSIDDGIETSAAEKGDGMQRALMLAILQAYADFRKETEDIVKRFLFFIDEAELHLHPTAQRKLKNALLSLAEKGDQVFINTHSSVLVSDDHEYQQIFRVEKINKVTKIDPAADAEKPDIVYELLGGSPADLLLPKNFLIVAGASEFELLSRVMRRFYPEKPHVQIVSADGDSKLEQSYDAIVQLFKPLDKSIYKEKTIILCDKPKKEETIKHLHRAYDHLDKNEQVCCLPTHTLEEYYPVSGKDGTKWRREAGEVSRMNGDDKKELAQRVGDAITLEQFEKEMGSISEALNRCWSKAFK